MEWKNFFRGSQKSGKRVQSEKIKFRIISAADRRSITLSFIIWTSVARDMEQFSSRVRVWVCSRAIRRVLRRSLIREICFVNDSRGEKWNNIRFGMPSNWTFQASQLKAINKAEALVTLPRWKSQLLGEINFIVPQFSFGATSARFMIFIRWDSAARDKAVGGEKHEKNFADVINLQPQWNEKKTEKSCGEKRKTFNNQTQSNNQNFSSALSPTAK